MDIQEGAAATEERLQRPRLFGILTAYKEAKFVIKEREDIDFYQAGQNYFAPSDFCRTNKGVLLFLEHKESKQIIVVCNA